MGRGEHDELPRPDRPAPAGRVAATHRRRLGSVAKRSDEDLRFRRALLVRPADGAGGGCLRERHGTVDLQLRPRQRRPGPERPQPRRARSTARKRPVRRPGRRWREGTLSGRADRGRREVARADPDGRLEGHLPKPRQGRSRIAAISSTRARGDPQRMRSHQLRARAASSRAETLRPATASSTIDEWYQCYPRGPASPPARRLYRGIELFARKSVGNSLWLQASYVYSSLRGNYDGGVNEGLYGSDLPRLERGLRLSRALARRIRHPRARSAEPLPVRRLLGHAVAPLRGSSGVRRVGRAAQPAGILQLPLRIHDLPRAPGLGRGGCRPCGTPTSRSPTRSRSAR